MAAYVDNDVELFHSKNYNIGESVVTVEQDALYIGTGSSYDDEDWLNIAKVYVDGKIIYDYKAFNYGPYPISDEMAIKLTLAHPNDIHSKYTVEQYEQYEAEIKDMSILERFFDRKTYNKLTAKLKRLEKDYEYIKGITDSAKILRMALVMADREPPSTKKKDVQPGSY